MLVGGLETAKGLLPQACGRASPAPTTGAARGGTGPLPGGRPVGAVRPAEAWPPHVAGPDLPGESGSARATREPPCLHGHVEAPEL
jgi:hypothetical protein